MDLVSQLTKTFITKEYLKMENQIPLDFSITLMDIFMMVRSNKD